VFHFRRTFNLAAKPRSFVVRVSGDNRYRLFVNGRSVLVGPARGDVMHWRYEIVDLAPHLHAGNNLIGATVWNWGELRPGAQTSHRTGFLLQAEDPADATVDSGPAWKVTWDRGYNFAPRAAGRARLLCSRARREAGREPIPLGLGAAGL